MRTFETSTTFSAHLFGLYHDIRNRPRIKKRPISTATKCDKCTLIVSGVALNTY